MHADEAAESEDRLTSTPTPAFPPVVTSTADSKDLPTPCSTPTQSRKNKRKSNLFTPNKKDSDKTKDKASTSAEEFGSGRAIPIKQGFLYKKSQKALSREWKKKYCTLSEGKLIYHPSLHDYMDDLHGKSIPLSKTTVKIPGQPPRGASSLNQTNSFSISQDMAALAIDNGSSQPSSRNGDADNLRSASASSNLDDSRQPPDDNSGFLNSGTPATKAETPLVKKRQTKKKKNDSASKKDGKGGGSGGGDDGDESDGYEFVIVSYDNKTWHFEASSSDERREWVQAIEQTIHNALQGVESSKSKSRSNTLVDAATISSIRQVNGNQQCVDCGALNPDWASLNLGALMCIECSGVHRNLGTHLSRVRSLDLDEWPAELSLVMTSIGNQLTNSVWEGGLSSTTSSSRCRASKPRPDSTREEKEAWIRAKFENKEFLAPLPPSTGAGGDAAATLGKQLIEAITRDDLGLIILLLAHSKLTDVNATYSTIDRRTPLHFSAALGSSVVLQLLLWHGADVNKFDHEARSALYFARKVQAADCVRILQNSGCPENAGEGVVNTGCGSGSHPIPGGPAALMASVMVSSLSNAQHHQQQQQQQQSSTTNGGGSGGTLTRHLLPGHQTQKQNNSDVFDKLPASVI